MVKKTCRVETCDFTGDEDLFIKGKNLCKKCAAKQAKKLYYKNNCAEKRKTRKHEYYLERKSGSKYQIFNRSRIKNKIKKKCIGKKKDGNSCEFKTSKLYDNLYCKQHKNQWQLHGKEDNFKLCTGHNCFPNDSNKKRLRFLIAIDDKYSKCEECRKQERQKDKEERDRQKKANEKLENPKMCACIKCLEGIIYLSKEMGLTKDGKLSNLCKKHFEQQQHQYTIQSEKKETITKRRKNNSDKKRRANTKRRKNNSDKIRKTKAKEWRKNNPDKIRRANAKWRKNNPDKTYNYYTKYRENQLKYNAEAFRKRNAENQAKRRKMHPKKKSTYRYNTIVKDKYHRSIKSAEERGYDFNISYDIFKKLVESDCYYCGCPRKKFLNGVDRLDNKIGYIENNIVSACKMCNYMKNTLNEATFILMCTHIIHYNKMLKLKSYPKVFNNINGCTYSSYKNCANKKNIPFEISEKEFNELRNKSCYICNKNCTNLRLNGIDRYDNTKGYIFENCQACCYDCNCMKKNLNHDRFLFQCGYIALQHKKRFDKLEKKWKPSRSQEKNSNKLSKEELKELRLKQKKEREEKTLASKSLEARQARMKEIRAQKILANENDMVEI